MAGRGNGGLLTGLSARAASRGARLGTLAVAATLVAACNVTTGSSGQQRVGAAPAAQQTFQALSGPRAEPHQVGKPYQIAGRWFHPQEEPGYDETGSASWYGDKFHGRRTANGERYDMHALTAAHPTLPLPSYARVTNLENGRSVVVRINDRGPFTNGRLIDLSKQTARILDFKQNGTAEVRVQYVGAAPAQGEDGWLTTTVRENGRRAQPPSVAAAEESPAQPVAQQASTHRPADLDLALR